MKPETTLQISCVKWFRLQFPKLVLFMITNDGKKTPQQGALDKARGLLAGMPDLMLSVARGGYNGLYIELKRKGPKGRPSDEQIEMNLKLTEQGYLCVYIRDINGFIELVINYLNNQINTGTGEPNGKNNV